MSSITRIFVIHLYSKDNMVFNNSDPVFRRKLKHRREKDHYYFKILQVSLK
jgi:hypothetical protein